MALLIDQPAVRRRAVGVVEVTGGERLAYLHTQLTQHLEGARPGQVADFLLLEPDGSIRAEGRAVVRAEDVLLLVAPDLAGDLAERLAAMTFLMDADAVDASDRWALASARGPEPIAVAAARDEPMTAVPKPGGLLVRDRDGGLDVLGEPAWVDDRVAELDLPEASAQDWEAWRVLHGRPSWGAEVGGRHRPQDLGLLPTHVHLDKGCYPGQEAVAKQRNLGRRRRALAVVDLHGPVAAGDRLDCDGKPAEVTSVAVAGDRRVGLAVVPLGDDEGLRSRRLEGDGVAGEVVRVVGADLVQPGA